MRGGSSRYRTVSNLGRWVEKRGLPFTREHGVYFCEFTDVAEKIKEGDADGPCVIIHDVELAFFRYGVLLPIPSGASLCVFRSTMEEPLHLRRNTSHILLDHLFIQRISFR